MALFALHAESKFQVGDIIRVHIQDPFARRHESVFEGRVLGIRGGSENRSVLVRRIGAGEIGIERIFPLASPLVTKVEVKQRVGRGVRRAKLYFLRGQAKSAFEEIAHRAARKEKVGAKRRKSSTHSAGSGQGARKKRTT